jgi:cyclopropane-fatty-acyl-phospholipid synthase
MAEDARALPRGVAPVSERSRSSGLLRRVLTRFGEPPAPFEVELQDGSVVQHGVGPAVFRVGVKNSRGLRALRSMHQLRVADAYIDGDIDFEGDLIAAITLKDRLSDRTPWLKLWRRLAPVLFGRERLNPAWVQKHYDSNNIQLLAADRDYNTYTPGIYERDGESLERGAERKLAAAFEALAVGPGGEVLDIGCGWGGFMRYAARRGVHVTGVTLSKHQLAYDRDLIEREGLDADVIYQDFFSYEPGRRFDGISMMGVMEDLSDYGRVFATLAPWLEPGGRIYLDFATGPTRFATGSFITKHIWPGTFRMVYMPEFMRALSDSPLELVSMHDDRMNYHLWGKALRDRWIECKEEAVRLGGPELWRMFHMLFAGAAAIMSRPYGTASAARLVLELPQEADV